VADPHSDLLLARGFLPFRRPRGSCEVRGRSANLWYAATRALGFDVLSIRCPDPVFVGHIQGLGVQVKSLASLPRHLRRPHCLPDVVFSDIGSIPLGPDSVEYWDMWTTPHLFYCLGSDDSVALGGSAHHSSGNTAITPPHGWVARSVRLANHETGGATSGRWTFTVWYPPHTQCVEPIAWTPHGGTPLLCCVNDRVRAAPYHGQRRSSIAGERVVREEGLVLDFGLFPASEPAAQVLVESSGSPSGYGSRHLSAQELGDLWDVPILLLDSLSDAEVTGLMEGICQSPPSKLLHTGADLLLTAGFRGGSDSNGRGLDREVLLLGPRPLTDVELGLRPLPDKGMGTSRSETQGLNWLLGEPCVSTCMGETCVSTLMGETAELKCMSTRMGETCVSTRMGETAESPNDEVIKGDHQKADNAAVPDHLWLRAFAMGYGVSAYTARHLEALNLPPTTSRVGFLEEPRPPAGWRGALPGLRLFALRHWRSRVTRDYISWRRTNVPIGVCDKG
jgi:hypothetical protein